MTSKRWKRTLAAGVLLVSVVNGCAWVSRVSVDSTGTQAGDSSFAPALSADGRYVAFESIASNLVAGDSNSTQDVFVRDTVAGTTTRLSVDSTGTQGNDRSTNPAISADGRYVAFESDASNLVAGDTNARRDVFVRDTVGGTTTRVSLSDSGAQANNTSLAAAISADGSAVAFASTASNLVAGDSNSTTDVFVRDTTGGGTTTRVSVGNTGAQANSVSGSLAISGDGLHVTFGSFASNLVAGDTNSTQDVFVRDRVAGTTTRVSVDSSGAQADSGSTDPAISTDGHYIAFYSVASNLVAGDTIGTGDVFVRDTLAGTTTRVSVDSSGTVANHVSIIPAISGDGRYVTFQSTASNLVAGDTNSEDDVFVRDTVAGTTTRVSIGSTGTQAIFGSLDPAISTDGRYVAFWSGATNLVAGDTNDSADIFVRANPQPTVTTVAPATLTRGTTTPITVNGSGFIAAAVLVIDGTGITLSNVAVVGSTQITADVTVAAGATVGTRNVFVEHIGTGPGPIAGAIAICAACVTIN